MIYPTSGIHLMFLPDLGSISSFPIKVVICKTDCDDPT